MASADSVVIRPHLAPSGGRDITVVMAAGLLLGLGVFGVPMLAAFVLYRATEQWWVVLGGYMAFFLAVLLFHATVVHSLRLDAEGITFQRRWGRPRHLPWSRVHRIRPAPPREVIVRGWLWPPVPPREATRVMTAEGHYAIEYGAGKVAYYPPADESVFLDAARRWGAGALHVPTWERP